MLAVLASGTYVLCSDRLSNKQAWAARIMCQSRHSLTGNQTVVIQEVELKRICARSAA